MQQCCVKVPWQSLTVDAHQWSSTDSHSAWTPCVPCDPEESARTMSDEWTGYSEWLKSLWSYQYSCVAGLLSLSCCPYQMVGRPNLSTMSSNSFVPSHHRSCGLLPELFWRHITNICRCFIALPQLPGLLNCCFQLGPSCNSLCYSHCPLCQLLRCTCARQAQVHQNPPDLLWIHGCNLLRTVEGTAAAGLLLLIFFILDTLQL